MAQLNEPCPAAPHRWWQFRRTRHDWYVRFVSSTTGYKQISPLRCSGMLLALDSGRREPCCTVFCERCNLEVRNEQAPVAVAIYALLDSGQPEMAYLVGAAQIALNGRRAR